MSNYSNLFPDEGDEKEKNNELSSEQQSESIRETGSITTRGKHAPLRKYRYPVGRRRGMRNC